MKGENERTTTIRCIRRVSLLHGVCKSVDLKTANIRDERAEWTHHPFRNPLRGDIPLVSDWQDSSESRHELRQRGALLRVKQTTSMCDMFDPVIAFVTTIILGVYWQVIIGIHHLRTMYQVVSTSLRNKAAHRPTVRVLDRKIERCIGGLDYSIFGRIVH